MRHSFSFTAMTLSALKHAHIRRFVVVGTQRIAQNINYFQTTFHSIRRKADTTVMVLFVSAEDHLLFSHVSS